MIRVITLIIIATIVARPAIAQSELSIPDSVCALEEFSPSYAGSGSNFFWHFCSGNLNLSPVGQPLNADPNLRGPAFISIADNGGGDYYALISNHGSPNAPSIPPSITRYHFVNGLKDNNPVSDNLGNFGGIIPEHIEGIQLKQDTDGNWYGFIVGGGGINDKLIRLDFGNSPANAPTIQDFGNINTSMDYPVDLFLTNENGHWIGFTVNYVVSTNDGYITRFDFPSGLGSTPTTTLLKNIGLSHPCGLYPINDNGKWYMFITNLGSSSITRLDFGSSLANSPKSENLGQSVDLTSPFDLSFIKDCQQTFGLVVNRYGDDIVRLDFPSGLDKQVVYTPLGNIGNLYNPHGITDVYRVDNEVFVFVANADNNTISRLYYETCTEPPSILTSNLKNPPPMYYKHEGNFNISLIVDQGLPTEKIMCKNIIVNPKPEVHLKPDMTVCPQSQNPLEPDGDFYKYLWSTNETTKRIFSKRNNGNDTIWLEVTTEKGCKDRDTIVLIKSPFNLKLKNDTTLVIGNDLILDAGTGFQSYFWSTGAGGQTTSVNRPGEYSIAVLDSFGCLYSDTVHVYINIEVQNFFTPNNDGYNDTWAPKLFYNFPDARVEIFDRFGKPLVYYKVKDYPIGWDGTYNGKLLDPDTYWYVIQLFEGYPPVTGQVTIKR